MNIRHRILTTLALILSMIYPAAVNAQSVDSTRVLVTFLGPRQIGEAMALVEEMEGFDTEVATTS